MARALVTVTGPPLSICSRNSGTTDPEDTSTLPKRTTENRVRVVCSCSACSAISAKRLLAPMTLRVRTALSVEMRMKLATPAAMAARAAHRVPKVLFLMPCTALFSTMPMCL